MSRKKHHFETSQFDLLKKNLDRTGLTKLHQTAPIFGKLERFFEDTYKRKINCSLDMHFRQQTVFYFFGFNEKYMQMLQNKFLLFVNEKAYNGYVIMKDGIHFHRANVTLVWFKHKILQALEWLPCSFDLNDIENVRGYIVRHVY